MIDRGDEYAACCKGFCGDCGRCPCCRWMGKEPVMKTKRIDGRIWKCQHPGYWVSDDDLHCHLMMDGTPHRQWEIYEDEDFSSLIVTGQTMAEALEQLKLEY